MTCSRHRTFTSRSCPACQGNRATPSSSRHTGADSTAQNLLTQSIVTNTTAAATACEPPSQPASANYCDTSSPSTFTDSSCPPSC